MAQTDRLNLHAVNKIIGDSRTTSLVTQCEQTIPIEQLSFHQDTIVKLHLLFGPHVNDHLTIGTMKYSLLALQLVISPVVVVQGWTRPVSWMTTTTRKPQATALKVLKKQQTPFTFPDDDCMDLCHHWVEVPDDDDDDVDDNNNNNIQNQNRQRQQQQQLKDELDVDPDVARIRMQMAWELFENTDNCDTENPATCGQQCRECGGHGTTVCRFCGGSKKISLFQGQTINCSVCRDDGMEVCKACGGSGWVAGWITLSEFAN